MLHIKQFSFKLLLDPRKKVYVTLKGNLFLFTKNFNPTRNFKNSQAIENI